MYLQKYEFTCFRFTSFMINVFSLRIHYPQPPLNTPFLNFFLSNYTSIGKEKKG